MITARKVIGRYIHHLGPEGFSLLVTEGAAIHLFYKCVVGGSLLVSIARAKERKLWQFREVYQRRIVGNNALSLQAASMSRIFVTEHQYSVCIA